MSYVLRLYCALYATIFALTSISAQIGCMDTSKHRDMSDGYDYKKIHYVQCSCACSRYKNGAKKARCNQCLHFHHPADIYQF